MDVAKSLGIWTTVMSLPVLMNLPKLRLFVYLIVYPIVIRFLATKPHFMVNPQIIIAASAVTFIVNYLLQWMSSYFKDGMDKPREDASRTTVVYSLIIFIYCVVFIAMTKYAPIY